MAYLEFRCFVQNPLGRMGLRGRGNLAKWGYVMIYECPFVLSHHLAIGRPNSFVYCVLTRLRRNNAGAVMLRAGHPVVEFLARDTGVKDDYRMCLPSACIRNFFVLFVSWQCAGMFDKEERGKVEVLQQLVRRMARLEQRSQSEQTSIGAIIDGFIFRGSGTPLIDEMVLPNLMSMSTLRKRAQVCLDERSTDNAWVESTVYWFHEAPPEFIKAVAADPSHVRYLFCRCSDPPSHLTSSRRSRASRSCSGGPCTVTSACCPARLTYSRRSRASAVRRGSMQCGVVVAHAS